MDPQSDTGRHAVLFVDDEPQALKYFEKAFHQDFPILTASGVQEAREILDREGDRIGVLVADQRMPGETGVELLSEVRRQRPQIVRILTTAYSELDNAIEAVNSGAVFRYVTKPWDLRDLRGILLRAMEFFHVQRERDILLREKLHVLQRMIVLDRVRSFTVLAASLACRIRNSMSALKAFLDLAPMPEERRADDGAVEWMDLWSLAQQESRHILDGVEEVLSSTGESHNGFDEKIAIEDALRHAAENPAPPSGQASSAPSCDLRVEERLPELKADGEMIRRMLRILIGRLGATGGTGTLRAEAQALESIGGAPGVRLNLVREGEAWSADDLASLFTALRPNGGAQRDIGMDMLAAFFIAYHHGGDLRLHTEPPHGPGFELLLPFDPEAPEQPRLEPDWLERIFTNLESWDQNDTLP